MRKTLFIVTFFLCVLSGQSQELRPSKANASDKVMNILKTDGTTAQTRLADLKQISFLTVDEGIQGLLVKTLEGKMVGVVFEANPVVTVSKGKLIIKSSSADTMEFEISDIAEILFGEDATGISSPESFAFVLQDGGALLRGIPKGVKPYVYSLDGRSIPTPPFAGGELRLSRATLGTGIFIVKVGSFSTKIQF